MSGATSRSKGNRAETDVARYLRSNGFPDAATARDGRSTGAQGGHDIVGVPGWAIEVKDAKTPQLPAWWRQACRQADDANARPLLIWHAAGQPRDPSGWVTIERLDSRWGAAGPDLDGAARAADLPVVLRAMAYDCFEWHPEWAGEWLDLGTLASWVGAYA